MIKCEAVLSWYVICGWKASSVDSMLLLMLMCFIHKNGIRQTDPIQRLNYIGKNTYRPTNTNSSNMFHSTYAVHVAVVEMIIQLEAW